MHTRAFQLCGYSGLLLAFVQSTLLVNQLHLSKLTLLGITGTVILTFYVLMMITKILAHGEVIIYYHHEIAVIASTAFFLRGTGQPVLPYLDILVLGLGLFLACGRIGCLMVGCCHGRPCRWGIHYGTLHADAGFPRYMVGVRLFPIQAVESLLALCIVASSMVLVLSGGRPGTALVFYVTAYGWGRFCLEFFRGDAERRYLWGFSEPQWTSLLLAFALSYGEQASILPAWRWHWLSPVFMTATFLIITLSRHFDQSRNFEVFHPRHVREILYGLDHLKHAPASKDRRVQPGSDTGLVHLIRTSLGYRISRGRVITGRVDLTHYCISDERAALSIRTARLLAELLAHFEQPSPLPQLIQGSTGVFHVVFGRSIP
jgi:hypothetical protein